jgi:signal peptidase II
VDDGAERRGEVTALSEPAAGAGPARVAWRARWLLVGLGAGVVLLDQLTKQLTVARLVDAEPLRLLGGGLYLVHATNSGAAFNVGSSYTWVFALVAFAVIGWIGWLTRRLRSLPWAVALGLVTGGAAGNLVDRLVRPPGPFRGEVVDMISVFAPDGSFFPVFNLADSSLLVGVVLAVWLELTGRRRDGTRVPGAVATRRDG